MITFGHATPSFDLEFIRQAVAEEDAGTVIEVGCFTGNSTQAILNGQMGRSFGAPGTCVYCVDTFCGLPKPDHSPPEEILAALSANMGDYFLRRVVPLWGPSHVWAKVWPQNLKADLILIDGDHSFEGCCQDLHNWWPHLKDGGLMLAHDYMVFSSVNKALLWAFGDGYANVARRDIQGARLKQSADNYLPCNLACIRK